MGNKLPDPVFLFFYLIVALVAVSVGCVMAKVSVVHPLAGIAAAFAGVSGGFSANLSPGQLDALLFGITESAVKGSGIDSGWVVNIAGNTSFNQIPDPSGTAGGCVRRQQLVPP